MQKVLISLALVLMLVAAMAVPAMAAEETLPASVTVTEYVSVTVTDNGTSGLAFGSLNPGAVKQPEAEAPAVTITTAAENNKDVDVFLKGTNFSDGGSNSFAISNAFYHDSDASGSATAMSATYDGSAWKTLGAGATLNIYHWLSVPDTQAAATYSSTFTYKTQAATP